ncbi:MAG: GTP-binding protein [Formivibrio sp.]|nr:GTP-binding protein [Formivibrio sp.]
MTERIPVNLITGFLGVGKTTALTRLLAEKPADEYWAVVVNEFGEVGIDGATLSMAGGGLQVAEVPGGCVCCTTSPMLRTALNRLVKDRRPDRLLIEPSGLGHPAGIVDLLRDPFMAKVFEVRAVVTLLDPRHLEDTRYTSHETWRDQIQLADVLVLNKCDLADAQQIERARAMSSALFPPKLALVTAVKGEFDPALLDLDLHPDRWPEAGTQHAHSGNVSLQPRRKSVQEVVVEPESWPVRKQQSSLGSHSCGWIFPPEAQFFSAALADLFEAFNQPESMGLAGLTRAKAVMSTERDWYRFDWVDGMPGVMPAAWRRDSRLEIIVQGESAPDWAQVEARLLAAQIG